MSEQLNKNKIEIIGLMSGTSLDGLDIAHVTFNFKDDEVDFELINYQTVPYSSMVLSQLQIATSLSVPEILILDKQIGSFYANCVNNFIKHYKINKSNITAIASHGQTIFHQPQNGFTYQIGCGSTLALKTEIDVINNFRELDVVAGGQGAPLVPIGDFCLFNKHATSFLNIGGFVNVSFKKKHDIIAYDICPGNLPLNEIVKSLGINYDNNGEIARIGKINFSILEQLQKLEYFHISPPKSLGVEWLEHNYHPLIKKINLIEDKLRTIIEHIAIEISKTLNEEKIDSVFVTGGGVKNKFLIERIGHLFNGELIIPNEEIIDYKEAIIFGFLGACYLRNKTNTLKSVTGAVKDVCSGVFYKSNK